MRSLSTCRAQLSLDVSSDWTSRLAIGNRADRASSGSRGSGAGSGGTRLHHGSGAGSADGSAHWRHSFRALEAKAEGGDDYRLAHGLQLMRRLARAERGPDDPQRGAELHFLWRASEMCWGGASQCTRPPAVQSLPERSRMIISPRIASSPPVT